MSLASGTRVILGDYHFPIPPNSLEFVSESKIAEHVSPNVEGGATEILGSKLPRMVLRGSLASGADPDMLNLIRLTGTNQLFRVSDIGGRFFASGNVVINKVQFQFQRASRFPYYEYVMELHPIQERAFELPEQGFGPKIYFWGGPGTVDPTVSGGQYRSGCFGFASGAVIDIRGTACVKSPAFDTPSLAVS